MTNIYRRTAFVLSVAVLAFLAMAPLSAFGQDMPGRARNQAAVDVSQTADCPLRLTLAPSTSSATLAFRVDNVGQTPVIAYTITARGARLGQAQTAVLNKWLLPGSSQMDLVQVDRSDPAAGYVVDYVRFAGGGSWGADSANSSVAIDANLAGRQAAIDRVKELVSLQDHAALTALLSADPAQIEVTVDAAYSQQQSAYRGGYRAAISWLAQVRDQGHDAFLARLAAMQ